ncbi:MAG TPA: 30S ribosomal protein S4 [Elusimicrobiales bacterium]|nr:30S ribosomal protein S4 [Elusimicrobiales bacterium]
MSRYTGPSCKRCRKKGTKMFLKGAKCTANCVVDREKAAEKGRKFGGGGKFQPKMSDYGKHLKEKQIARYTAQVNEAQFRRFFAKASKEKGQTGTALLRLLETRLDNIVRRLGFAASLKAARQLVNHGHVKLNHRTVTIPSCLVKPGDSVAVSQKTAETPLVKMGLESADKANSRPSFLAYDPASLTGKLLRWPDRAEMSINVDDQLIVEFYSK